MNPMRVSVLAVTLLLSSITTAVAQTTSPAFEADAEFNDSTSTPIKHVVIIYGENVSFDHYFGTYPYATNAATEPPFVPREGTPSVNGYNDGLLFNNPNFLNKAVNGAGASNPFRLDRSQAATKDQDHGYTAEQQAFDAGLMDAFPAFTGVAGPPGQASTGLVMGYYDGNTVTALWNYAQRFAMNDNSYETTFGPSTPGALNLISGQTNGVIQQLNGGTAVVPDGNGGFTLIGDRDPFGDGCSSATAQVQMGGKNIGDLLNARGITWGWFQGGFDLTATNANGSSGCTRTTTSAVTGVTSKDYNAHHQPFQYYSSTANPQHVRPASIAAIGVQGDPANHQYDITDFYAAVQAGNFPAVSFLKAAEYQDGHAGYSDPLDEQAFVTHVINFLQSMEDWDSTAVIVAYDDSDGWYDHQLGQIINHSTTAADAFNAPGQCGDGSTALPGIASLHAQGRCGYGPRLPLLVVSPLAKRNFVDHTLTDQSSVIRFIEDNWLSGQRIGSGSFDALAGTLNNMFDFDDHGIGSRLLLNESTGEPTR